MRRIRDVMRLKHAHGLSERQIAASLSLGKGTVGAYLGRARKAGLGWPLPPTLSDDDLELLLFPAAPLCRIMSVPCRIGRLLIGNFVGLGSRGTCFGKNIARPIPLALAMRGSASTTRPGGGACARRCARAMWGARRSSSILPGTRSRSSIRQAARCGR